MSHNHRRKPMRPYPTCKATGKRSYDNEADAEDTVELIKECRKRRDKTLAAYECVACGGWHVGHSKWRKYDE